MKRAAETQLTRDIADIEQDDQEDFRPFQQADEATLAGRKFRSLPRRRGLGGQSKSSSPSPAPSSFGLKQTTSSPTTEGLAAASTTAPATTVTPFAFGKPHSAGSVPNFSFNLPSSTTAPPTTLSVASQQQPPASPPSSNPVLGHKPRASFSQPSTSSPLKKEIITSPSGILPSIFASPRTSSMPASDLKPKPNFSFPISGSGAAVIGTTSALSEIHASQDEVDYWKGLRGLNVSFLAMARNLYEEEVFADLSELFTGYCKMRNELNEKQRTVPAVSAPFPTGNSTITGGGFSFAGKSVSLGSLAPPTSTTTLTTGTRGFPALTTGFSFGGKTASFTSDSGSSAAAAAGSSQCTSIDVDGLEDDKGDEKMGEEVKEAESQQPSLSEFGVATKQTKDGGSGFSFGALPGAKPISSFGGFGASSGTSDFKGFGFSTMQGTTTATSKQPFSFSLPPPGTTKPPGKMEETSASTAPKPAFGFGLPPPSSTTAPTSDSRPAFGFGLPPAGTTSAPTSTLSPVPDEKKSTSVGGFGVGNLPSWLPAKNSPDSNTRSGGSKPVGIGGSSLFTGAEGFGFGGIPPTPAGSTPGTETPAVRPDGTSGGEDYVPSAEQRYDVEGPGEEDEDTVGGSSWRAKVWQLGKARGEDGREREGAGVEWIDFGVSFVRLKKHKTTGSKRILARHSKTGHIVMNFAFFPQLSPKVADKGISFVGVSNGELASFKMRLQTAEQAAQLLKTWKGLIDTE